MISPTKKPCGCGKPVALDRNGVGMCRECAIAQSGNKPAPVVGAAVEIREVEVIKYLDPEPDPASEAKTEAFAILAMESGYQKARKEWLERWSELVDAHRGAESREEPQEDPEEDLPESK